MSVNFISLATSCVGPREEGPQTAYPMSTIWASHITDTVLVRDRKLPNQSTTQNLAIGVMMGDSGPLRDHKVPSPGHCLESNFILLSHIGASELMT